MEFDPGKRVWEKLEKSSDTFWHWLMMSLGGG